MRLARRGNDGQIPCKLDSTKTHVRFEHAITGQFELNGRMMICHHLSLILGSAFVMNSENQSKTLISDSAQNREIVAVWAAGEWVYREWSRKATIEAVWNQTKTLKYCLCCHSHFVILSISFVSVVGAFHVFFLRWVHTRNWLLQVSKAITPVGYVYVFRRCLTGRNMHSPGSTCSPSSLVVANVRYHHLPPPPCLSLFGGPYMGGSCLI